MSGPDSPEQQAMEAAPSTMKGAGSKFIQAIDPVGHPGPQTIKSSNTLFDILKAEPVVHIRHHFEPGDVVTKTGPKGKKWLVTQVHADNDIQLHAMSGGTRKSRMSVGGAGIPISSLSLHPDQTVKFTGKSAGDLRDSVRSQIAQAYRSVHQNNVGESMNNAQVALSQWENGAPDAARKTLDKRAAGEKLDKPGAKKPAAEKKPVASEKMFDKPKKTEPDWIVDRVSRSERSGFLVSGTNKNNGESFHWHLEPKRAIGDRYDYSNARMSQKIKDEFTAAHKKAGVPVPKTPDSPKALERGHMLDSEKRSLKFAGDAHGVEAVPASVLHGIGQAVLQQMEAIERREGYKRVGGQVTVDQYNAATADASKRARDSIQEFRELAPKNGVDGERIIFNLATGHSNTMPGRGRTVGKFLDSIGPAPIQSEPAPKAKTAPSKPGEIAGMEGPIPFKGGRELYYDAKQGQYYDRGKDMYVPNKEMDKLLGMSNEPDESTGPSKPQGSVQTGPRGGKYIETAGGGKQYVGKSLRPMMEYLGMLKKSEGEAEVLEEESEAEMGGDEMAAAINSCNKNLFDGFGGAGGAAKGCAKKGSMGLGSSGSSGMSAGQSVGSGMDTPGGTAGATVGLAQQGAAGALNKVPGGDDGKGAAKPGEGAPGSAPAASPPSGGATDGGVGAGGVKKALTSQSMVIPVHMRGYDPNSIARSATTQTSRMYTALAPPVQDTLQQVDADARQREPIYKSCGCGIAYKSDQECPRCSMAKSMVPRTDLRSVLK
jgi:hypothetical protein